MQSGLKENLVRIDVADARQHLLVHQQAFQPPPAPQQQLFETPWSQVVGQGVDAQFLAFGKSSGIIRQGYPPQSAGAIVDQAVPVLKHQHQLGVVRVARRLLVIAQKAGHTEMQHQPAALVQPGEQVFAPNPALHQVSPGERFGQSGGGDPLQNGLVKHQDILDAFMQRGGVQVFLEMEQIGKFRHLASPPPWAAASRPPGYPALSCPESPPGPAAPRLSCPALPDGPQCTPALAGMPRPEGI